MNQHPLGVFEYEVSESSSKVVDQHMALNNKASMFVFSRTSAAAHLKQPQANCAVTPKQGCSASGAASFDISDR